MKCMRLALAVAVVILFLAASARWSLRAQDRPEQRPDGVTQKASAPDRIQSRRPGEASLSVQDALEKPFTMPFAEPTALEEVCKHLRRILNAPVVLDLAALDRQDLRPDDTVELELTGVRLKTGLKLLLDQVGLSYKVVAEDNLLVLTDKEGSDDPLNRVLAEVKEMHRDIHDVQDALDEVRAALGLDDDEGAKMRKPTIIEEMQPPLEDPSKAKATPPASGPRPRPGM